MFKQTPSRNHRGKGLRMKYAIKIFILVAICIWLLYQVKHSHDQKRAFEAGGGNMLSSSLEEDISPKIFDVGRKVRGGVKKNHEDEAVDDEEAQDSKPEENEDDDNGTGDDKMDENDVDKVMDDAKHDGAKENNLEISGSSEHKDQHVVEANSQEAREKQYQEDDASSAVVREARAGEADGGGGDGLGELIRQQVENPAKKESDFGDGKDNATSEVAGYGQVQGETGNHTLTETLVISEKATDGTGENDKFASDNNQSNSTSEVNIPDVVPGESGDRLSLTKSLSNGTSMLTPVQDGDHLSSTAMPRPIEHANDVNSTLLSSNNATVAVVLEGAADFPLKNATIAPDSTHNINVNSTVEEEKIESLDAERDIVARGDALIERPDGNDTVASGSAPLENSSLSLPSVNDTYSMALANSTQGLSSPDVTAPLEPVHEKNSSVGLMATDGGGNSGSYEDGGSHLEAVVDIEGGGILNATSKANESETILPASASLEAQEGAGLKLSDSENLPEKAAKETGMVEDA